MVPKVINVWAQGPQPGQSPANASALFQMGMALEGQKWADHFLALRATLRGGKCVAAVVVVV